LELLNNSKLEYENNHKMLSNFVVIKELVIWAQKIYQCIGNSIITLKFRKGFATLVMVLGFFNISIRLAKIPIIGGNNWAFGEWLINYGGGFVRRGLFGEIFILLTPHGEISLWFLFFIQIILIFTIWIYFIHYLNVSNFSWQSIALACSPLSICFLSWDQYVFARKELIGIFCLVLIAINIQKNYLSYTPLAILVLIIYSLAIFSSEVNLTILPGIIYLFWLANGKKYNYIFFHTLLLFILISFFSVFTSFVYRGGPTTASKICNEIMLKGLDPNLNCNGSVSIIGMRLQDMIEHLFKSFPGYFLYIPILILALLPILTTKWIQENRRWVLLMFIGIAPLFFLAWDYGRWIFILATELSICLSLTISNIQAIKIWNPISTFIFVCFWGSGHTGNPVGNGWIGLIPTTIRDLLNIF